MFKEKIKFPEDFKVAEMKNEENKSHTLVSMENIKWGIKNLHVLIDIKDHGVVCDAMICIGKEVEQIFGEKKEVIEKINHHISKLFREKAREKNLYYGY